MKYLILSFLIAVAWLVAGTTANAGEYCETATEECCESSECNTCNDCCGSRCFCIKRKVCTTEEDRCYFTKTKCFCGCKRTVHFVEITYKSTYADKCGNCSYRTFKVTKRVSRCDIPS